MSLIYFTNHIFMRLIFLGVILIYKIVQNQDENTPSVVVGIVENDTDYRLKIQEELSLLAEVSHIHAWESAESFWRDSKNKELDILILDIKLDGMDGVELAGRVSESNPETRIIMLSNLNSDKIIFQALRNGAIGYMLKSELSDIASTLKIVMGGGAIITPTIAYRVLSSFKKSNTIIDADLTDREKQVLELMVSGKTIAKVADTMGVSKNTVNHHAKNIYKKLNVHNRTELARKAASAGLLDI